MNAQVSISQLYYNKSILNFFFRSQSEDEFNNLFDSVEEEREDVFNAIENYSDDLDNIEEMFYSKSIEEIISNLGLTAIELEEDADE